MSMDLVEDLGSAIDCRVSKMVQIRCFHIQKTKATRLYYWLALSEINQSIIIARGDHGV